MLMLVLQKVQKCDKIYQIDSQYRAIYEEEKK